MTATRTWNALWFIPVSEESKTVNVDVVDMTFDSLESPICAATADHEAGTSLAEASVTPSDRELKWELMDNDIGVSWKTSDGNTTQEAVITEGDNIVAVAGSEAGTAVARVCDSVLTSCTAVTKELTVVAADLKSIEFTSDHEDGTGNNILRDNNSNWKSEGDPYKEPEWKAGERNNPISHTKDKKLTVKVKFKVEPAGITFELNGDGPDGYVDFKKSGITSSGEYQVKTLTADAKLPDKIDTMAKSIDWTVDVAGIQCDAGKSGGHKIYVTHGIPSGDMVTEMRVAWSCTTADGENKINEIVDAIQGGVQNQPPYFDGYKGFRYGYPDKSHWEMMTPTEAPHWNRGDCYDYAELIQLGALVVGVPQGTIMAGKIYASRDDGNAFEDLDHHPDHGNWDLRFVGTPGFNRWEGTVRVKEDDIWYYYTSVPDLNATHDTANGASIKLLRAYVQHYNNGKQEYYDGNSATGEYEPLPPAP